MCCKLIKAMLRTIVFIINVVLVIAGLAILILGSVYLAHFNNTVKDVLPDSSVSGFAIAAVVIGSCIFLFAFLGFCGAAKKHKLILLIYGITVIGLFAVQIALGITAVAKIGDELAFEANITADLTKSFLKYPEGGTEAKGWDVVQETVQCCGINGRVDYANMFIPPITTIPDSCHSYTEGCGAKLSKQIYDAVLVIGVCAIVLSLAQLASGIFSLCMSSSSDD